MPKAAPPSGEDRVAATMIDVNIPPQPSLMHGYSFEICARDVPRLAAIRPLIPAGTVVSITYLPAEPDEARIAAAREVRRLDLVPMPHVAARRLPSIAALDDLLDRLAAEAAVDRLFVIAGDLPAPLGPFPDALAVLDRLCATDRCPAAIAIAGYPDGHPQIATERLDQARRDKIALLTAHGATIEIMTQFAFDAAPMLTWLDRVRGEGFIGRVRLGLPGPASVGTLLRFAARCGVGTSAKVMAKYGASVTRLLHNAGPDRLYAELARGLVDRRDFGVGIHLYPFGGLDKMADWVAAKGRG